MKCDDDFIVHANGSHKYAKRTTVDIITVFALYKQRIDLAGGFSDYCC